MKDLSLHQAAQRLGLTRPELIKRMKAAGLLDSNTLPAAPVRDRLYLRAKETSWHHPELGMQYSHSTKVRPAGVAWLADKLGIPPRLPAGGPGPPRGWLTSPGPANTPARSSPFEPLRNAGRPWSGCRNTYGNLYEPT